MQERERVAALRYMLQSADTAANRARTKHNFRMLGKGSFAADFEVPHHRSQRVCPEQKQRQKIPSSAAQPVKLKRTWIMDVNSRQFDKHLQEHPMHTKLEKRKDSKASKLKDVDDWLSSAHPGTCVNECDTSLESSSKPQFETNDKGVDDACCVGDQPTSTEAQVGAAAAATDNYSVVDPQLAETTGEEIPCHVSCDDLLQNCLRT